MSADYGSFDNTKSVYVSRESPTVFNKSSMPKEDRKIDFQATREKAKKTEALHSKYITIKKIYLQGSLKNHSILTN